MFWVVFAEEPPEFELSASLDGLPGKDLGRLAMRRHWASFSPGLQPAALRRCQVGLRLGAILPDPGDLSQLQIGAAVCRGLARLGAVAVFDWLAIHWWSRRELLALAPDRPFSFDEHVTMMFETEPGADGHLCHTRGMAKFARPELFMRGLRPAQAQEASDVLQSMAQGMAEGKLPDAKLRAFPDENPAQVLAPSMFANASVEVVR